MTKKSIPLRLQSRPVFQDTLPLWPDAIFLVLGILCSSLFLGIYFGYEAVIPLNWASTGITCLFMVLCLFALFRFFLLSNYVIYFVASIACATIVFATGHLFAYWMAHRSIPIGEYSLTPDNLLDFFITALWKGNPWLLLNGYKELFIWLTQALVLGLTSLVAPLMVCIMFAEAEEL